LLPKTGGINLNKKGWLNKNEVGCHLFVPKSFLKFYPSKEKAMVLYLLKFNTEKYRTKAMLIAWSSIERNCKSLTEW